MVSNSLGLKKEGVMKKKLKLLLIFIILIVCYSRYIEPESLERYMMKSI